MPYFNKILIANRGEIARRIIRTCRRLGIQTVAVYSEADADMPFVKEADEAVLIGPAPAAKSYMDVDKVMEAVKSSGAQAVHPGYGFLSENAAFAQRCELEGVVFIGPKPDTIEAMGSKIAARNVMQKAGVPVVPGWSEDIPTVDEALRIAQDIGYPMLLKASAGGGGIGMQVVTNSEELKKAFDSTKQRAQNYFGSGEVFLEKWINQPRHIEVQVVRDTHGNALHLYERECSIQRRNQKVIEESPSPFLTEEWRKALLEAALKGIEAIGYTNLGTMEFIFDSEGHFYFLEMNTRLQVEHPVTEAITGLDLVELQLKIAAGEPLGLRQADLKQSGHALECRVYAEDPKTFYPSPGPVKTLALPEGARYDFAVETGNQVTPFYDPMIGKVITHGPNRQTSIEKMTRVLEEMTIEGLKTNLPLLIGICRHEGFREGRFDTGFLSRNKVLG
jgi:acetyl-CoA carboxylase biotin carboxylase subunit